MNPNEHMPLIHVFQDKDDIYQVHVQHADQAQFPGTTTIDLGPNPTWMSPVEMNDAIAKAVRDCLDAAWESATGEKVDRDA